MGACLTGPSLSCPSSLRCGATHPKRKEQKTMTTIARRITGGVDTHLDVHVAAALDERGAQLGVESLAPRAPATRSCWAGSRASAPSSWSVSKAPAATGPD